MVVGHRGGSGQGRNRHGRRTTRRRTRPIREGGTGPAVVPPTQSDRAVFLRGRGVRAKRDPESPRRPDRAPGRCRAGGGLPGGKDPAGRSLTSAPPSGAADRAAADSARFLLGREPGRERANASGQVRIGSGFPQVPPPTAAVVTPVPGLLSAGQMTDL